MQKANFVKSGKSECNRIGRYMAALKEIEDFEKNKKLMKNYAGLLDTLMNYN
jgi:hypothetical protein